ncbi:MAG: hypothetical protein ACF8PG_18240 [Maioricimonas sp. JB045]|uniref:hypothetical protein n=1 Tax=Maioricimonas sp. JC845 TaxID=3232138 RepID=UPI0034598595
MQARLCAAALMLLSGVTHVSQLVVYVAKPNVIGAALFGVIYFVIGLLLWWNKRVGLWLGAILPTIGGVLGAIRFASMHRNPFSIFHIIIDLIVVPICVWLLFRPATKSDTTEPAAD